MVILAEKPKVAKSFAEALGARKHGAYSYVNAERGVTITHCVGHLLESAEPEHYNAAYRKWSYADLPIIPDRMVYLPIRGVRDVLNEVVKILRNAVKRGEEILIATDAGREGEVIARLVLAHAGVERYGKIWRFWESAALTPEVVLRGIEGRKPIGAYDQLARVGLAWKESDWIYGINITRLYSVANRKLLSVGRVQTAVLHELYRREEEISQFVSREYAELLIVTEDGCKATLLRGEGKGKDFALDDPYLMGALAEVKRGPVRVVATDTEEKVEHPPQLHNSTSLYREAYRLLGMEPERTAKIAQSLYEERKVLSYPRTSSRVMREENLEYVRELFRLQVKALTGIERYVSEENFSLSNTRLFKTIESEDHHAIVPTAFMEDDGSEEYEVWRLVQTRFLMQGMRSYRRLVTRVRFQRDCYVFEGQYGTVTELGWRLLAGKDEEEEANTERKGSYMLHELVRVSDARIEKKRTKPKPYYTYDTLLAFMENPRNEEGERLIGIGTDATRPAILAVVKKRGYIRNERKTIRLSDDGRFLVEEVRKNATLQRNISAETTTEWERLAQADPERLIEETKRVVREAIQNMEEAMAIASERETFGKCPDPKCGGSILEGEKIYYCSNYKEENGGCGQNVHKRILGVEITKDMMRTLCTLKKIGFYEGVNRDGEEVVFGIRVGKEDNSFEVYYANNQKPLGSCPLCKRNIVTGKKNYYCEGYKANPRCEFVLWKDSNGAHFTQEMVRGLLRGEEVHDVECKTAKDEVYYCGFKLRDGELVRITYGGQGKKNG